jgi:hypothetical protein
MKTMSWRLLAELIAWCALFLFPIMLFPGFWPRLPDGGVNIIFTGLAITNLFLIAFYYFNYYVLIPKLYFSKKYFVYILCLGVYLIIMIVVLESNKNFNPLPSPPFRNADATFVASIIVRFIVLFLLSLGISSYNRLKQIEREKMKAELSLLKAQINPHFLFNTLNSIYALTVKKSDVAPESVTRLSSIMRYVITDAAQELVLLEKEIAYITNYVELEELRLTSKVNLSYKITGDPAGKQIAPLIFLPYIENAFKHGVSTRQDSSIDIQVRIEGNDLHLLVKNQKVNTNTVSNGLGMENARMRLQLLYPGRHKLLIEDTAMEFWVSLAITLA